MSSFNTNTLCRKITLISRSRISNLVDGQPDTRLQAETSPQDAQQLGAEGFVSSGAAARGATRTVNIHRELGQAARGLGQLAQALASRDLEDLQQGEDSNYGHLREETSVANC